MKVHAVQRKICFISFATVLLVAFLTNCAFFKQSIGWGEKPPELKLSKISIEKISLKHVHLKLSLSIQNSNESALTLSKLQYKLSIKDEVFATGLYQDPWTVEAKSTALLELPMTIKTTETFNIIAKLLNNPSSKILSRFDGSAYFHSIFGQIKLNFSDEKPISR